MNIQIFGSKKNNDSRKAECYFKECGISFQFIDMKEKGMSKGEFDSVCQAVSILKEPVLAEPADILFLGGAPYANIMAPELRKYA